MGERIRVCLADDHAMVREGLRAFLSCLAQEGEFAWHLLVQWKQGRSTLDGRVHAAA